MEKKKKLDLASIATIPLTMTLANSILIPVLPSMQKAMGITAVQSSLLITAYAAVAIIFIPIAGYLSDRIGRKKVILPGLLLVAAAGAFCGFAAISFDKPYAFVMTGRLFQGLGAAGCFPVVLPLVGDLFKKEEDVSNGLGLVETANTFGKVLAPIIGSALAMWTWYMPFWFIPVFSLISFLLVAIWVKAPKDKKPAVPFGQFVRNVISLFHEKGRWIWGVYVAGGINMFAIFASLFYLSEILEERGSHGILKGCLVAIPLAALCSTSWAIGKWIGQNKKLMKWISVIGFIEAAGSFIFLAFGGRDSIWFIIIILFAGSIGLGAALPSLDALLTEGIEKEQRGTITSIYSSIRFLGVAAGPPLAALLIAHTKSSLFWLLTACCVAAALIALFTIKPKQG